MQDQRNPRIAVDGSGILYLVWEDYRNGNWDVYFASSNDGGANWTDPNMRVNTDNGTTNQREPAITATSSGTVYVAWRDYRGSDADIMIAWSNDSGATWTDPNVRVNTDTGGASQQCPDLTVDASGNVYVVWGDDRGGDWDIYFAKSINGGVNWTDPNIRVVTGLGAGTDVYPRIAVSLTGAIHVAWEDYRLGDPDIRYANSTDGGMSWTNPSMQINIDSLNRPQARPSIVVGDAGLVVVVWQDHRNGNADVYLTDSMDGGTTWNSMNVRVNSDATTRHQGEPDIAIDSAGVLHVVWHDQRSGNYDIYYSSTSMPARPPVVDQLTVDGYLNNTVGIQHILNKSPEFGFRYVDPGTYNLSEYNVSVWDSGGVTVLWYCARTTSVLSGSIVTEKYNVAPCPTNGPSLVDGTTYKLRVVVQNEASVWSEDAEAVFHMNEVLSPVAPVTPANGILMDCKSNQTVSWTPPGVDAEGDATTGFSWEVSTDPLFATVLASGSGASNVSDAFDTCAYRTYYWRVNATDGWEYSEFGNAPLGYWNFSTNPPPTPNSPPVITNGGAAPAEAVVNTTLSFTYTATDPDGDNLTWTIVSGPSWLQIGAVNGTIFGRPSDADVGTVSISVQVSDGRGGLDTHSFSLVVRTVTTGDGGPDSTVDAVLVAIIVIIILLVVGVILFLLYSKRRRKKEGERPGRDSNPSTRLDRPRS